MVDETQLENVEYFKCVDRMVTNDARCTREIKSGVSVAKSTFNKMKALFASKLDLNLRTKLVMCYIWCTAVCGAETWTLRKVDQKYLERFEMWCWRRVGKISLADRVKNEAVLHRVEEKNILRTIKRRKADWIGHILRRNCLLKDVIEGNIEGRTKVTGRQGRRCKQLPNDVKQTRCYWQLKGEALPCTLWRTRCRRCYGPVVTETAE
jgi:hypothetical protein